MRYLSLHLPTLATDRIARRDRAARIGRPEAETGALPPPPLATVAKVGSAFRLQAVDARAAALGLKPGLALADARAMHPGLDVREADPAADAATLAALVDWCRLFTPLAAPDGKDGAVLDVTGVAHLFGGETALLDAVAFRLARQGIRASAAIAGTPGAAWALARFARREPEGSSAGAFPIVAEDASLDDCARLFSAMPLAALRLEADLVAKLRQAGLQRIGDLLLRPRAPIAARFGRDIHARLDGLLGQASLPISPRFEAPAFLAERRFAEGIATREDVEATILSLCYDLCGLLARSGEGARQLDVSLYRVDGAVRHVEAGTSRPLREPLAMARLFRERLEAIGEDGLDTGYGFEMVRLAATAAERVDERQPDWTGETAMESETLADLVDRLGARFGFARVTRLGLADSHQPERAAVAVAAGTRKRAGKGGRTSGARAAREAVAARHEAQDDAAMPERPIRVLERPEPIDTVAAVPDGPPLRFRWRRVMHHVAAVEGPERIAPDWWRHGGKNGRGDDLAGCGHSRDYFRAEDTEGRRFWLYREGLYRDTAEPRWFLHGFFA